MTTLDNGVVVEEGITAAHITTAADVPFVFLNGPRTCLSITGHHWGELGQKFNDVRDYLASNNDRNSSAHYVAEDGRVACIVSPDDAAWHAGNSIGNSTSIGIEMRPEATDGDYATVASLIRFIRSIYGDIPLIPHNHWINTQCPGNWDLDKLDNLARQTADTGEDMPTAQETAAAILEYQLARQGGPNGVTNLGAVVANFDAAITGLSNNNAALRELISQLAIKQGVTIDYDAIARAVNDDAAKRLAK